MYTVYILFSEKLNKYYTGYTGESVGYRLHQHLANHAGFSAKAKDWKIVFTELFENKKDAFAREQQIKAWKSASRIEALIRRSSTE